MSHSLRWMTVFATAACAVVLCSAQAWAQEAERHGARAGVSLLGGLGAIGASAGDGATVPLGGLALRFGGAFTDRFHLHGEFVLAAMPGGKVSGLGELTAFHAAIDLAGQGYIGPRFFLRGGLGAGWACATTGNSWYLPLPGPRFSGAVGYDLWARGNQRFSLALEASHTILYRTRPEFDRLTTFGLNVGFDWY